jgi:hypothetical protein
VRTIESFETSLRVYDARLCVGRRKLWRSATEVLTLERRMENTHPAKRAGLKSAFHRMVNREVRSGMSPLETFQAEDRRKRATLELDALNDGNRFILAFADLSDSTFNQVMAALKTGDLAAQTKHPNDPDKGAGEIHARNEYEEDFARRQRAHRRSRDVRDRVSTAYQTVQRLSGEWIGQAGISKGASAT